MRSMPASPPPCWPGQSGPAGPLSLAAWRPRRQRARRRERASPLAPRPPTGRPSCWHRYRQTLPHHLLRAGAEPAERDRRRDLGLNLARGRHGVWILIDVHAGSRREILPRRCLDLKVPLTDFGRIAALRQGQSLVILVGLADDVLIAALDIRQRAKKRSVAATRRTRGSRRALPSPTRRCPLGSVELLCSSPSRCRSYPARRAWIDCPRSPDRPPSG